MLPGLASIGRHFRLLTAKIQSRKKTEMSFKLPIFRQSILGRPLRRFIQPYAIILANDSPLTMLFVLLARRRGPRCRRGMLFLLRMLCRLPLLLGLRS